MSRDQGPVDPLIDPFYRALLSFPAMEEGSDRNLLLDDFLNQKTVRVNSVERQNRGGRSLIVVKLQVDSVDREFWVDPARGYLVVRTTGSSAVKAGATERKGETIAEVVQFVPPAPGLYFPKEVVFTFTTDGAVDYRERFLFADIKVNQPIPPQRFDLTFPVGTQVHDLIESKQYVVGPEGGQSRVRPLSTLPPPPSADQPANRPGETQETQEEPTPWTWWILPVSVVLVCVGSGILVVRRLAGRMRPA